MSEVAEDINRGIDPGRESAGNTASDPGSRNGSGPDATGHQATDPVAALARSVDELAEQVQTYHARAQARERVIDQLHAELERLRVGERALLLRPVVTDLQRLRADLLRHATTLPPQIDHTQAAALLESFALSVELTLERCAIQPIRPAVGARFCAREHRAVTLVAAASPDEDGTIALVVAEGYHDTSTDRVTVPARVHVRRWTPPSEQQENNADV